MKINKNIPLERYTDNVRKLILTPHSPAYTLMLSGIGEKDLNTALRLMRQYKTCENKQEAISAELRARIPWGDDEKVLPIEWKQWFREQWNLVCMAFRRHA